MQYPHKSHRDTDWPPEQIKRFELNANIFITVHGTLNCVHVGSVIEEFFEFDFYAICFRTSPSFNGINSFLKGQVGDCIAPDSGNKMVK
jgi:hypothetical protein